MLVYNNKEYRNLQEQVQKNKADIEDWKSKQETLANWGIRIVGQIEDEADLPEDYTGDYGDAYQVGTGDTAKYYAWIRPTTEVDKDHWMDMGSLSIAGPQGPAGDSIKNLSVTGYETYESGNRTVTKHTIRMMLSDGTYKDFQLLTAAQNGEQGQQGQQGIQGEAGPQGPKGEKGDVGPQGEMGPTAPAFHLAGQVESTSQLPDPVILKDLTAAYLIGKELWVQIGITVAEAKWTYLGDLSTDTTGLWEISGTTIAPVEEVDLVQCNNLSVLKECHLVSPSISGITQTSAVASPLTSLLLSGKDEIDLSIDGTNKITIDSDTVNISDGIKVTSSSISMPKVDYAAEGEKPLLTIDPKTGTIAKTHGIKANGSTLTANTIMAVEFKGTHSGLFNGDLTGNVTGNVTGNLIGNVTGDLIGNVTGDLTGDLTGNVTTSSDPNAGYVKTNTIKNNGDWFTIECSGYNVMRMGYNNINLYADADNININGTSLSELIAAGKSAGYNFVTQDYTLYFESGNSTYSLYIPELVSGGFAIFTPGLYESDIEGTTASIFKSKLEIIDIYPTSLYDSNFNFSCKNHTEGAIIVRIRAIIGYKDSSKSATETSQVWCVNALPQYESSDGTTDITTKDNTFTGNNTFNGYTIFGNTVNAVAGLKSTMGTIEAYKINATSILTKKGIDVATVDDLASYATTADLASYATQTYVTEQIQTAIGDALEGEY